MCPKIEFLAAQQSQDRKYFVLEKGNFVTKPKKSSNCT